MWQNANCFKNCKYCKHHVFWVAPSMVSLILLFSRFLNFPPYVQNYDLPPAVLRFDNDMVDMRLLIRSPEGEAMINPSLLVSDTEVILVARRHSMDIDQTTESYDGNVNATIKGQEVTVI